jgi:hypothetical protein
VPEPDDEEPADPEIPLPALDAGRAPRGGARRLLLAGAALVVIAVVVVVVLVLA